jgi:hypothetical protein
MPQGGQKGGQGQQSERDKNAPGGFPSEREKGSEGAQKGGQKGQS